MTGELRGIPEIRPAAGEQRPASQTSVQQAVQQLAEMIHKLEGRLGTIALRDDLRVAGDITSTGALEAESLTLSDTLKLTERDVNIGGGTAPDVSAAGEGTIYFDRTQNQFQVSENGGAFQDLVYALPALKVARIRRSTAQSIPNAAFTAVTLDTVVYDTGGFWTAAAPTRLTIPTTGTYSFGGNGYFATGGGQRWVSAFKNGVAKLLATGWSLGDATYSQGLNFHGEDRFTAGDYIEMIAYQDSGAAIDLLATTDQIPAIWIHELR